jgi:hypothetical protein
MTNLNGDSDELVERDISGETVCGFRVAAWRETHPEHGDKYGHAYSEHWSTPNTRDPRVKVERLFTEDQLRAALTASNHAELSERVTKLEAELRHARTALSHAVPVFPDLERRIDALLTDKGDVK